MWELKVDSTSEEVIAREAVKEDKHNRKRSPTRNKPTVVRKTGDTEDTMNNTILDRMNMERGISQKMSPRKNGR